MRTMTHIVTLFLEAKLGVNCDSKVLYRIGKLENHSMNVVNSYNDISFICDSNDLAFSRMKIPFYCAFPRFVGHLSPFGE